MWLVTGSENGSQPLWDHARLVAAASHALTAPASLTLFHADGIHDLQEAGLLPGLHHLAFDVSGAIPPDSWYGTLLKGTFNFSPATTWLEAGAWLLYVIPVLFLYVRANRSHPPAAAVKTSAPNATVALQQ